MNKIIILFLILILASCAPQAPVEEPKEETQPEPEPTPDVETEETIQISQGVDEAGTLDEDLDLTGLDDVDDALADFDW